MLGRLDLGAQGCQKLRFQKHQKHLRKINVFGRFLEATSLQKTCKVAVWRSCCGLEALKSATWMPYWLQTWIKKASLSFRSTKLGSGSLHVGSNLRSDGLENWKVAKTIVKPWFFEGLRWPKMGPRGLQELSCRILPLFVAPFWAHLGLSWTLLGPSSGVQEGISRQILGSEGLLRGCKLAKS